MRVRDWWWEAVPIRTSAKTVALKSLPNRIQHVDILTDLYKRRFLTQNHSDHVWIIKFFFSFICFSIVIMYKYTCVIQKQKKKNNENRLNIIYLFEIIILILYYILYYDEIPFVIFPRETCRWAWRSSATVNYTSIIYNIHIFVMCVCVCDYTCTHEYIIYKIRSAPVNGAYVSVGFKRVSDYIYVL
jgi:hypothetical protein